MSKIEKLNREDSPKEQENSLRVGEFLNAKHETTQEIKEKTQEIEGKPKSTDIARVHRLCECLAHECSEVDMSRQKAHQILKTIQASPESFSQILNSQFLSTTAPQTSYKQRHILAKALGMDMTTDPEKSSKKLDKILQDLDTIKTNQTFQEVYSQFQLTEAYKDQKKILMSVFGRNLNDTEILLCARALEGKYPHFKPGKQFPIASESIIILKAVHELGVAKLKEVIKSEEFKSHLRSAKQISQRDVVRQSISREAPFSQTNIFRALTKEFAQTGKNWKEFRTYIRDLNLQDPVLTAGLLATIPQFERSNTALVEYVVNKNYSGPSSADLIQKYNDFLRDTDAQESANEQLDTYIDDLQGKNPEKLRFTNSSSPQVTEFRTLIWDNKDQNWDELQLTIKEKYAPHTPEHIRRYFADVSKAYGSPHEYIDMKSSPNPELSKKEITNALRKSASSLSIIDDTVASINNQQLAMVALRSEHISDSERAQIAQVLVDSGYEEQVIQYNEQQTQSGQKPLSYKAYGPSPEELFQDAQSITINHNTTVSYDPDQGTYTAHGPGNTDFYIQPELLKNPHKLTQTVEVVCGMGLGVLSAEEIAQMQNAYNEAFQDSPHSPWQPLNISDGISLGIVSEKWALQDFVNFIRSQAPYPTGHFDNFEDLQVWNRKKYTDTSPLSHIDNNIREALWFDKALIGFDADRFIENLKDYWEWGTKNLNPYSN